MENIKHQGVAPYAGSGYQVFRNVKDQEWGAKGDGVTDDTAAIQLAISAGSNCPPTGACQSSSTTPALIYFPPGTYVISSTIDLYYGSSLVGNPNCPPVLKAASDFNGAFLIDGNKYGTTGNLAYGATNTFWRQFRNFVIDVTSVPASAAITGLHWPTAQATSVENTVFKMSAASGTQHGGILSEQGSGGFMGNLTFYGGIYGLDAANQQFTMRNLNFYNAVIAIKQDFNWGWVYKGISINNCHVGIQFGLDGNPNDANFNDTTVSSVTLIDSSIVNTPVGILLQVRNELASRPSEESLIIENLSITNVPIVVGTAAGPTLLPGTTGSTTIAGWGRGSSYTATAHTRIQGNITPATRPSVLKASNGGFYTRSKPQYETYQNTSFVSVRSAGAKGDGVTDDTTAIISAITSALVSGSIVYFDAGYYVVSKTIYIPPGSKITGEGYPVILATGSVFGDITNPVPVFQVGKSGGEKGTVEWSNMIVSTKGAAPGAILIEWNLDATGLEPAGLWDVHTRIGGFTGSDLQVGQCPTGNFDSRNGNVTMTSGTLPKQCIGAFMSLHVTKPATGLYLENVWLWVADHDVDDASVTQITIFAGRGLLVESTAGAIWMYGTAVEHHALYQYQLSSTANIYMGEIQTETPYYQPNPNTAIPFTAVPALNDPPVESDALGLRILNSNNILIYGAGLYSFFSNYNVHCSDAGNGEWCQSRIFSVEQSSAITVYGLDTVGTQNMITVDGNNVASYVGNVGATGFIDTIAKFTH
ncbi:glycoside hydrolase family 55 protein [Stipitochalara longipes BDJ]|nr:glycoside hydrolase family 55 protein [Stipitochalara longipes BDJ]